MDACVVTCRCTGKLSQEEVEVMQLRIMQGEVEAPGGASHANLARRTRTRTRTRTCTRTCTRTRTSTSTSTSKTTAGALWCNTTTERTGRTCFAGGCTRKHTQQQ